MSTPSRELLIVSPERWDEACFSVPAVRALAGSGLGIGLLCQPHQKDFWQTLPGLPVHAPDELDEQWQVALVWEAGELAKVVSKADIHKRMGPSGDPKLAKHLTETLNDSPHPSEHRVQFYLKAVAEMGVKTAKPEYFSPVETQPPPPARSALLIPDSDYGSSHEWPSDNWLQLAEQVHKKSHSLTILTPDFGSELGEQLLERLEGKADSARIELAQPGLELLAKYERVIAADGSLPHLAAHMGATCLTLFGPNDMPWRRPLGTRHRVARKAVECSACMISKCPLDLRCQNELSVDAVLAAFEDLA